MKEANKLKQTTIATLESIYNKNNKQQQQYSYTQNDDKNNNSNNNVDDT